MSRALVLNATYEPLCVVSCRRALILVMSEKAELVHATGVVINGTVRGGSNVSLEHQVTIGAERRSNNRCGVIRSATTERCNHTIFRNGDESAHHRNASHLDLRRGKSQESRPRRRR